MKTSITLRHLLTAVAIFVILVGSSSTVFAYRNARIRADLAAKNRVQRLLALKLNRISEAIEQLESNVTQLGRGVSVIAARLSVDASLLALPPVSYPPSTIKLDDHELFPHLREPGQTVPMLWRQPSSRFGSGSSSNRDSWPSRNRAPDMLVDPGRFPVD